MLVTRTTAKVKRSATMGFIKLLNEDVINKIAAGEVVQRPASVLKEFVENSLDAGATEIEVELSQGGIKLIRVIDNGSGVKEEDIPLALQRHATSKIESAEDLFSIDSMGFRGEALASIAAVSRLTLTTRHEDEKSGTQLRANEKGLSQQPWSGQSGTSITVEDLFYNTPARLKFLKSPATEYSYCIEFLQSLALSRPEVLFSCVHNDKEVLRAPPAAGNEVYSTDFMGAKILRARVASVHKKLDVERMVYHSHQDQHFSFEMMLSPPGSEKATTKNMLFFVNKRLVKDPGLRSAFLRGYHSHLLRGRFPQVYFYLKIDPALVDVNVHPNKTEIKFQYNQDLFDVIAKQIRIALRQGAWAASSDDLPAGQKSPDFIRNIADLPSTNGLPPAHNYSASPPASAGAYGGGGASFRSAPTKQSFVSDQIDFKAPSKPSFSGRGLSSSHANTVVSPPLEDGFAKKPIENNFQVDWQNLKFIGCFQQCYLIYEDGSELLIVDQHAFHERILYEKLKSDEELISKSQPLLVNEGVTLSIEQIGVLLDKQEVLESKGFGFSKIDDTTIEVSAVPVLLEQRDLEKVFYELSQELVESTETETMHHIISTIACHSAVRAGETLTDDDLKILIAQAQTVDFYHNCPHGRRVFTRWKLRDVQGWFDRV